MNNSDNRYYSSRFRFGSNDQNISLIMDTQTDWTIVLAKDCNSCWPNTDRYDRSASTTHQTSNVIKTTIIPFGDNGQLNGRTSIDQACLVTTLKGEGQEICTDSGHTFFEVQSFTNLNLSPYYSGIMGLSPDDP